MLLSRHWNSIYYLQEENCCYGLVFCGILILEWSETKIYIVNKLLTEIGRFSIAIFQNSRIPWNKKGQIKLKSIEGKTILKSFHK